MVIEQVVAGLMTDHEAQLVRLERLEEARREDHEQPPALGADRGRIEYRAGIDIHLYGSVETQAGPAGVQDPVHVGGHLGREAERGGQKLAAGAHVPRALLELLKDAADVAVGEQPLRDLPLFVRPQAGWRDRRLHAGPL